MVLERMMWRLYQRHDHMWCASISGISHMAADDDVHREFVQA
jgi:hypothetical protein